MSEPIPIHDERRGGDSSVLTELRALVREHRRITDVLRWLAGLKPAELPLANVAQDEFTHDVVVRYRDGMLLAYEVT